VPDGEAFDFFDSAFLRKLETLAIFSRKAFAGRLRGEQRSQRHGSSVEFADFRPYSQGDDFRRIDWNAYARFGNLFLKLFTEEEDLFLYVLLDRSASMAFGDPVTKFDLARRLTAALSYIALSNLDRVAVFALAQDGNADDSEHRADPADDEASRDARAARPADDHLAFVRGKGAIFSVFEYLRQLRPAGRTDLVRSVRGFLTRQHHKGVVVILSDFLSPTGYEDALKQLAFAGFQPMVIHVMARDEIEPDLSGDFRLIDSETGRPVDISTTRRMLEGYHTRTGLFIDGLGQFCRSHNIAHLHTTSDADFDDLILGALRRAALVK